MAAAGGLIAMSIEGWIQRWKVAQVFFEWQTLIAGVLALAAAAFAYRAAIMQVKVTARAADLCGTGSCLTGQVHEIGRAAPAVDRSCGAGKEKWPELWLGGWFAPAIVARLSMMTCQRR